MQLKNLCLGEFWKQMPQNSSMSLYHHLVLGPGGFQEDVTELLKQ